MYSEKVMEHFRNPKNVGSVENPDGVGQVGNPVCGDIMRIEIKVENGRVVDAKFKTFGCGAAIATSSMVTELVKGKTLEEAMEISNKAVAEALEGLPPVKMHCSNLAADALHKAIEDYLSKHGKAAEPGKTPDAGKAPEAGKTPEAAKAPETGKPESSAPEAGKAGAAPAAEPKDKPEAKP